MFLSGGYGYYLLFSLPALLLGFWAQNKVRSAYNKFSKVRTYTGLTGSQVARKMLDSFGLNHVQIEETRGMLSDHYDPRQQVLRLSQGVFRSNSVSAAGIAAHEAGHAIQDARDYGPLRFRTAMVPTVQIGSWIGPIIFMIGLFLASSFGNSIAWVGILLFSATAIFSIATLPVELDASKRAKAYLADSGIIYRGEIEGINKVLDAAALTYVAGAIQAITTVLYYVFLLSGRRRN